MDLYSQLQQSKKRSRGDGGASAGRGGQASSMIPTALRRKPQPTTSDTAHSSSSASASSNSDPSTRKAISINLKSVSSSQDENSNQQGTKLQKEVSATTAVTTQESQNLPSMPSHDTSKSDDTTMDSEKKETDQQTPDMSLHAFPTEEFDEYDPVNPNDYEEIVAERERRKQEERARIELQRQMQAKDMERQRLREEREQLEKTYGPAAAAGRGRGRGVDLRPEWLRKQQDEGQQEQTSSTGSETTQGMSGVLTESTSAEFQESPQFGVAYGRGRGRAQDSNSGTRESKPRGMELAAKMMHGWGYQEGKGLGKDESGITTPLEHEKVGKTHGRIRNPDEEQPDYGTNDAQPMNASRIVLLQNMVGRGKVDNDLQSETAEECSNFGPVIQCVVDESKESSTNETDAVRIFVEFENEPTAVRAAVNGLHGRKFGGRKVLASFYPEHLFESRQLR